MKPNHSRNNGAAAWLAAAASCLSIASASAQDLPANGQILVPFAPGGPVDFVARLLAGKLAAKTGGTFTAENKPGANGAVAAAALIQLPPTGQTLMITGQGIMTIATHLSKLPFDPLRDITPISGVAFSDVALVVGAQLPASNLKEFVELAKSSKPLLALASGGNGNITHLYIERFKDVSKTDFLHVPYKGVGPAVVDVMSGQIAGVFTGLVAAMPNIRTGKLKALGVVGDARSRLLPDVPTLAEQGYPVLDVGWVALVGPPKMRPETIRALAAAVGEIVKQPDTHESLAKVGLNPWLKNAEELSRIVREESGRWGTLIREKNIKE